MVPGTEQAAWRPREWLPELDVPPPEHQDRWTIALRLLLAIPSAIILFFLDIASFFVAIVGWFAALVLGRLPSGIGRFLYDVLAWSTRLNAYLMFLTGDYPPFSFAAPGYPVRIEVRPTPLNRLAVFFRIILVIPAAIVTNVFNAGWWAVSFILWLIVLIRGRVPEPLFQATAAITRYTMRTHAYFVMLTSAYPKRWFGDKAGEGPPVSATRPLILSQGARWLLILFIVLGVLSSYRGEYSPRYNGHSSHSSPSPTRQYP